MSTSLTDWEDRIGEIDDAKKLADDIVSDLEAADEGDSALSEVLKLAREAADSLATAETVETEKDFDLCLRDAWTAALALGPALKVAKERAKKDGEEIREERLGDARSSLKQLVRELRDALPEVTKPEGV